jgi:hypothetical protein
MRKMEVIVCRECGGDHCTVEELFEKEKITMEEYARRHPRTFPNHWYSNDRTARRFVITCQDCGEQYEFMERIEPLPQVRFNEEEFYNAK